MVIYYGSHRNLIHHANSSSYDSDWGHGVEDLALGLYVAEAHEGEVMVWSIRCSTVVQLGGRSVMLVPT